MTLHGPGQLEEGQARPDRLEPAGLTTTICWFPGAPVSGNRWFPNRGPWFPNRGFRSHGKLKFLGSESDKSVAALEEGWATPEKGK